MLMMNRDGRCVARGRSMTVKSQVLRLTGWILMASQMTIALFAILIITEKDALAYSDPGSGALIWQMVVASMFGGMFYFRKFLGKFRSWGKRKGGKDEKENHIGSKE
jgi:hypothetical protein